MSISRPPSPEDPRQTAPLALELPAPALPVTALASESDRPERRGSRAWVVALWLAATFALLAGVAGALTFYLLPRWMRQRFIDAAAAQGVTLTIDRAAVEAVGFRLTGLRATWPQVPGASVAAPELLVETAHLRPEKLTVHGAELLLRGPLTDLGAALGRWRASTLGGTCSECEPTEFVVDGSHVLWQGAMAGDARLEATNARLSIAWRGHDDFFQGSSDHVTLTVARGTLGPWRVDVERKPHDARLRIALDPAVPEASTLLVVGDGQRMTHLDVDIPRSSLSRLGVPPALLGIAGAGTQVEAALRYVDIGDGRAEAHGKGRFFTLDVGGWPGPAVPRPLDVAWEAVATGDPEGGMDLSHARLAAGPLVGPVTGTFRAFDDGVRLDARWNAAPVPCNAFEARIDSEQPFDVAYPLRQLAEATGALAHGHAGAGANQIGARGTVTFDSRDADGVRVELIPEVTCPAGTSER